MTPMEIARKFERIALENAKRFAAHGVREKERFWLRQAKEARNAILSLARKAPN